MSDWPFSERVAPARGPQLGHVLVDRRPAVQARRYPDLSLPHRHPLHRRASRLAGPRHGYSGSLPPYVITPKPTHDGAFFTPGQSGSCLGSQFDPLVLNADPNSANFQLPGMDPLPGLDGAGWPGRVVLAQLDRHERLGHLEAFDQLDELAARAATMVSSGAARRAFDLTQETDATAGATAATLGASRTCSPGGSSKQASNSSRRPTGRALPGTRTSIISSA